MNYLDCSGWQPNPSPAGRASWFAPFKYSLISTWEQNCGLNTIRKHTAGLVTRLVRRYAQRVRVARFSGPTHSFNSCYLLVKGWVLVRSQALDVWTDFFYFIIIFFFSFSLVLWAQLSFHAIIFNKHTIIILFINILPAPKVYIYTR